MQIAKLQVKCTVENYDIQYCVAGGCGIIDIKVTIIVDENVISMLH